MKARSVASVVCLGFLWSVTLLAQDPLKVDPSHYKLLFENETVRVLKVSYPVGASSKMHQHPENMIVMLAPAKVRFTTSDGKTEEMEFTERTAMNAPAMTHMPTNVGTGPVDGILVEFKSKEPGKATLPDVRDSMGMKVLAESPHAVAYLATADASFHEPAGSKHDFDQIVIAPGAAEMSLALEGKPAKTKWQRGDVVFIGRGVPHESKNISGKPTEFILVAIR